MPPHDLHLRHPPSVGRGRPKRGSMSSALATDPGAASAPRRCSRNPPGRSGRPTARWGDRHCRHDLAGHVRAVRRSARRPRRSPRCRGAPWRRAPAPPAAGAAGWSSRVRSRKMSASAARPGPRPAPAAPRACGQPPGRTPTTLGQSAFSASCRPSRRAATAPTSPLPHTSGSPDVRWMLSDLAGLSGVSDLAPRIRSPGRSRLSAAPDQALPGMPATRPEFPGQQQQRRRQRPQQRARLLLVVQRTAAATPARRTPRGHRCTPPAAASRPRRSPARHCRGAAPRATNVRISGVRPDADTATTRSIGPTQPGSVGPPRAKTGSGEPRPATAASTSPVRWTHPLRPRTGCAAGPVRSADARACVAVDGERGADGRAGRRGAGQHPLGVDARPVPRASSRSVSSRLTMDPRPPPTPDGPGVAWSSNITGMPSRTAKTASQTVQRRPSATSLHRRMRGQGQASTSSRVGSRFTAPPYCPPAGSVIGRRPSTSSRNCSICAGVGASTLSRSRGSVFARPHVDPPRARRRLTVRRDRRTVTSRPAKCSRTAADRGGLIGHLGVDLTGQRRTGCTARARCDSVVPAGVAARLDSTCSAASIPLSARQKSRK